MIGREGGREGQSSPETPTLPPCLSVPLSLPSSLPVDLQTSRARKLGCSRNTSKKFAQNTCDRIILGIG